LLFSGSGWENGQHGRIRTVSGRVNCVEIHSLEFRKIMLTAHDRQYKRAREYADNGESRMR